MVLAARRDSVPSPADGGGGTSAPSRAAPAHHVSRPAMTSSQTSSTETLARLRRFLDWFRLTKATRTPWGSTRFDGQSLPLCRPASVLHRSLSARPALFSRHYTCLRI